MPTINLSDVPGDYWQLRALSTDAQRIALEARTAVARAQAKQDALVATLAERYGFDPKVSTFTLDDDTLTLTTVENSDERV